jgi:hypothetical protein
VAAAVLLHEPPFPARAGRHFGGLLMAMLAKDPAARPTAPQVRQALSALAAAGPQPRRRRWWPVPAMLAAVVALGGGGWYAVSALRAEPETGRFATALDACTLLSAPQVTQLMKGTSRRKPTKPGECEWVVDERPVRTLTVRAWVEKPTAGLSGPELAKRRFASMKAGRAAAKGQEGLSTFHGEVSDVKDVGEAAIMQNSFEFSGHKGMGRSSGVVLFQVSNLLGEVVWHREDVPAKQPKDDSTTLAAARLVAANVLK